MFENPQESLAEELAVHGLGRQQASCLWRDSSIGCNGLITQFAPRARL